MMDTKLNLPFFQTLFLRSIIINICIGDIICFSEKAISILSFLRIYNFLAEIEQLIIAISDITRIKKAGFEVLKKDKISGGYYKL